jgi:hypothetical protein
LLRCQHQLAVHLNWQFICVSLDRELANKFSLYACVQPALWFGAFWPWSGLKFDSTLGFACVFLSFLDEKTLR